MGTFQVGDKVLVHGEVLEAREGVGVKVELFSKTDQYAAWIREDLVTTGIVLDIDTSETYWADAAALLREHHFGRIALQIAAQIKPRIEEPTGLGAVVVDVTDDVYVRRCPGSCEDGGLCIPWSHVKTGASVTWSQITPRTVLSEGVEV